MKESEYNEIDRLLRNLAGRERSMPGDLSGAEHATSSAHLDADELSSYAEGALPAATRARYTSHVADCDDCRHLVSQLSIAAGSVVHEDKATKPGAISRWRQILATLLTPVVLRYAMPALALLVVGTVTFLALRQQQRADSFVAVNKQAETPASAQPARAVSKDPSAVTANAPVERQQKAATPPSASVTTEADKVTPVDAERKPETKKSDAAPSSAAGAPARDEKEVAKNEPAAVAQPTYAPDLAAAPPQPKPMSVAKAPAKVGEDRIDKLETRDAAIGRKDADKARGGGIVTSAGMTANKSNTREKSKASIDDRAEADRRAEKADRAEAARDKRSDRERDARSETRSETGREKADRSEKGAQAERSPRDEKGDSRASEESESRTVNGKRFQRRDGAWIDTAYKSSATTINVARGSEQYRALIADEPGIDSIAKQLSGEIVLVWKGRSYRIH